MAIVTGDRVSHRNACRSYGDGRVLEVIAAPWAGFRPYRARVLFDVDTKPRTVSLTDLTRVVTPAPMPGSGAMLRLVWPPQRADEVMS